MRLNSKREGKSFLLLRGGGASVSSLRFPWWDVMAGVLRDLIGWVETAEDQQILSWPITDKCQAH